MKKAIRLPLLLLISLIFLSQGLNGQQRAITPEDIMDLQYIGWAGLSPDGQQIAYTLSIPGGADDKPSAFFRELYVVPFAGGTPRAYITKPNTIWGVNWGPKGENIYFLSRRSDLDAHTQVYSIALAGGEAELVTSHEESVAGYHLSPDGKWLAFTSRDGKTSVEKANEAKGMDWVIYGENSKFSRIYLQNLETGKTDLVFKEDLNVTDLAWTPDAKQLIFRAAEDPSVDHSYMFQKIYKVDAQGGKPAVLCKTDGKLGHIEVSPDGKTVAWAGAVDISDPLPQSLFTVPISGGEPKNLSKNMEASVNHFVWKDDKTILLQVGEGVYNSFYSVDAKNGKMKKLYGGNETLFNLIDFHFETGNIAAVGSSSSHPRELFSGNLSKLKFERRTNSNEVLKEIKLAKQEVIEWKGPDGWKIQGILTYPLDYQEGKTYPLLLQIHGGPEGNSQHGFNTRSVYPIQLYASKGFFVLEPNYRGSAGRGVAFAKGDHNDLAGKEFEDVLAGIDDLVKKKLVDPNKVGTGGFSYGGYFSAWAATKHSDRFKAAMVGAGITNWLSFTGTTDIIYENSLVHWNLWWYDDIALIRDRSPISHINNAKTPTLIVHGEKDVRVPLSQGEELYNALRVKDVPTQMIMYKRQPHGIRERPAAIDYMNRTLGWYEKYVK